MVAPIKKYQVLVVRLINMQVKMQNLIHLTLYRNYYFYFCCIVLNDECQLREVREQKHYKKNGGSSKG